MAHEWQYDEWKFVCVDDDADESQYVLVTELPHRQRLVDERLHHHGTARTVHTFYTTQTHSELPSTVGFSPPLPTSVGRWFGVVLASFVT